MFNHRINPFDGLVAGAIGGLAGAWVKAQVEPAMRRWAEGAVPPERPDPTRQPHGDPTVVLAERSAGHPLAEHEREAAGSHIHYAFGGAVGAAYGAAAEVLPFVTAGTGTLAAAALWFGAHEVSLPALGLTPPAEKMPASNKMWELGSHLAYGVTAEVVRRVVRFLL